MTERLKLNLINTDGGTQVRAQLDIPTLNEYGIADVERAISAWLNLPEFGYDRGAKIRVLSGLKEHKQKAVNWPDLYERVPEQAKINDVYQAINNVLHRLSQAPTVEQPPSLTDRIEAALHLAEKLIVATGDPTVTFQSNRAAIHLSNALQRAKEMEEEVEREAT
jgi:hypothetical protein